MGFSTQIHQFSIDKELIVSDDELNNMEPFLSVFLSALVSTASYIWHPLTVTLDSTQGDNIQYHDGFAKMWFGQLGGMGDRMSASNLPSYIRLL